jgi:phosphoribosylaminoimidazole-succinocarboxamide synthase
MSDRPLLQSALPGIPVRRGKVRDVYDFGDRLLFVATDRLSAFDWVLPTGIPDKGKILTRLSEFWFERLNVPHHLLPDRWDSLPLPAGTDPQMLAGRSLVVKKTRVFPIECVVRGYLVGSGWKEYQQNGSVCGVPLPAGLRLADRLPAPVFTPATKAETGHDENISFDQAAAIVSQKTAEQLRQLSLEIYAKAVAHCEPRGVILADTKFEFGVLDDQILLIDEVLTPDSSRYWPAETYRAGSNPPSFDKQFVRDWLESTGWDKQSPPPPLPEDVVHRTHTKYLDAFERVTGEAFRG